MTISARPGARPDGTAGWARFLAGRITGAVLVLGVLSVLVFVATEALPGDAAGGLAGPTASAAEQDAIRAALGLDRPAVTRYREWVGAALHGDLGTTFVGSRPVTAVLADRLPASLLLAGLTLAVVVPVATVLGLGAGMLAGRAGDRVISTVTLITVAVPEFLTAALLAAVFGRLLGWLPAVSLVPLGREPWEVPAVLVLPVATSCVVGLALGARLLRAAAAQVAAAPHVEAARLRGVRGPLLAVRHVLPSAAGPAVQSLATVTGALVGGSVVVETAFGYPGVGLELVGAVARRDVPLVQGLALVLSAVVLAALLLGDVVARLLDGARRPG